MPRRRSVPDDCAGTGVVHRSQRSMCSSAVRCAHNRRSSAIATWQVPNTVIQSIIGRLPPGGLATGNTSIEILDNDHRLFADNRRTQIDMRFAKILRFGSRRARCRRGPRQPAEHQLRDDVREHISVQRRQCGDGRHLEQPDGNLHSAVRPLEPDGRLLRCSVPHTLHLVRGFCGAARGRNTYHLPRGGGTLVLPSEFTVHSSQVRLMRYVFMFAASRWPRDD